MSELYGAVSMGVDSDFPEVQPVVGRTSGLANSESRFWQIQLKAANTRAAEDKDSQLPARLDG